MAATGLSRQSFIAAQALPVEPHRRHGGSHL
jgi:hypothetical protein